MQKRRSAGQACFNPTFAKRLLLLGAPRLECSRIENNTCLVASRLDVKLFTDLIRRSLVGLDDAVRAFDRLERYAFGIAGSDRDAGAVHVLLAQLVGEHGDGDR